MPNDNKIWQNRVIGFT